jgi:glyoxylase-like metal-dependent hydrolase (beta-lactamase superfamily II)
MKKVLAVLMGLVCAFPALAHNDEPMNLDDLLDSFGWDFDEIEIRTEKVTDNFYVLFGGGGNIGVSVGAQGVLIVDDQFPELIPKIGDAIRAIGGGSVDFAVNTHWHFDHAEGNLALGPGGTWLVSQANSREKMLGDHVINMVASKYLQKAYPKTALPVITYDDTMQFHFNDERVDLMHFGPAHTTGDTAGIFSMIAFCQAVLDTINEDTVVVPGHGEISDYEGLKSYIAMLSTVHDRIAKLAKRGKSLEEVAAADVTRGFDDTYGDPSGFIDRAYASITRD